MESAPIVARLWDYGWLGRDSVKLEAVSSDTALVEQYVASSAFHTSFLPSDKVEAGIHGPFVAERIKAGDFELLDEAGLEHYLMSVQLSEVQDDDVAERAKILPYLRCAFEGGRRCYVLMRDERNKELFHDWGFVFLVFREFLFASQLRDSLDRFIIGYD